MSFKQEAQKDLGFGRSFLVKRCEWGARPSPRFIPLATPVGNVIIHHTTGDSSTTPSSNATAVRYHQRQHLDFQHRIDIAFNFLVGEDGKAYEGRGWAAEGEHTVGSNGNSIGIAIIGDYSESIPNAEALDAIRALISMGVAYGNVKENYTLKLHRETENNNNKDNCCPGDKLYEELKTWPNFVE